MFRFFTSVDAIVADLQKKVQLLEGHAEDLKSKADDKSQKAKQLVAESNSHVVEADRAQRVAAKVRALLD